MTIGQLEGHYLAGGHVRLLVQALISADKADIALTFDRSAAIDLAGRNVLEAVQMSVLPKVLTSPKVTAMAKYWAGRVAVEVCDEAIQLLGGYGYMTEFEVERFYRDSKIVEIYEGTKEIQKNTIASYTIGKIK